MIRIKTTIAALIIATMATPLFSQDALSTKAMYIELGGAGIAASLNYEQTVWMKNSHALSLRGGLGYAPLILNTRLSAGTYGLIVGLNYNKRINNHLFTLGISNTASTTIANGISDDFNTLMYSHLIIPNMGYRYQRPEKNKLFAGIGYSPILSYDGLSIENRFFQFKNHFYLSVGLNL